MITIENLTKSFGAQVLFENIGVKLNHRERVGLVGRNGHGKTTLFRIIAGEESADSGNVLIPKNYRLGYIRQQLDFKEDTVLAEGIRGLLPHEKDHHWKVEKILAGLGFSNEDLKRSPLEFSGGFQVRLNLAKVLVSEPDLLLLDEPTNYLDITSIRWIERFLNNWTHELMLITHDRSFMDKVVTHTIAIHRKKIRKIEGNTEKLYAQIAMEEEVYEKTRVNDERKRKEVELFISRFRAKARLANMVQSRIKTLGKMEKQDKLENLKALDFSFRSKPFQGKTALTVENLNFSYEPDKPLIKDFSVSIAAKDRICVIGKNGKGKTTLIKLLGGMLEPHTGKMTYNPNIVKGFYEQTNVKSLVDSRTVEEEILCSSDIDRQSARNICGAMMFEGDDALKKIEVLSGGEKSRVMLGKLLATPLNFLLLDEPTNHLDMDSCDAMLAAIDNFKGAVVMVTHNEMFLHALADRLIVFKNNGIEVFDGGYARFLEKGGWEDEDECKVQSAKCKVDTDTLKLNKKELRRKRSEIITERSKLLKPLEIKIAKAENDIDRYEKQISVLHEDMQAAALAKQGEKIKEIARAIHTCETGIEKCFEDLEALTPAYDGQNAIFEKKLEELGEE